ncbi:MAG: LuxR C-terminal-related transcriptional regulator [Lysobacterales bacterium]
MKSGNEQKPHGVVLVEDDHATLDALSAQVANMPHFQVLAAVDSLAKGLSALAKPYQLLMVDIDLGDGSGIDLIRASQIQQPDAKVLVISVLGDERTVVTAVEAGADGYVLKDSSSQTLTAQLASVMADQAPISPGVARHLLRRIRDADPAIAAQKNAQHRLTPREIQVLECLAHGLSYKEVARQFDLSIHTVGDYVKALYRKLRVRSRGQAVNVALQHRLIKVGKDNPS